MQTTPGKSHRLLFVSSNATWGGSEELWSSAAETLAASGHSVSVKVSFDKAASPRFDRLSKLGCKVSGGWFANNRLSANYSLTGRVFRVLRRLLHLVRFRLLISRLPRQDLIVISQGGNHDGARLASICRGMEVPYVLIAQKAAEMYWPTDDVLAKFRAAYAGALHCFFVSHHNWHLTEEQLGQPLAHASVVRNPFLVPWQWEEKDWPDTADGFRLACVGRLYPTDKGQDLLLRVLARTKWRQRPLRVSFYGTGPQAKGLENMARFLGLSSVSFAGFVDDIASVWQSHHGLVMPSRCEGLPLAIVEAMLCGRLSIVTDVAGNGEVVEDGRTGFIATAATEDALDAALEKAWQRRDEWRALGLAAATAIRELVPADPARVMADTLLQVLKARAAGIPAESQTLPYPIARPSLARTEHA